MPTDTFDRPQTSVPATPLGSPAAQAVEAYLARLAPHSRRMVLGRLRAVAPVLADPDRMVPWHTIDYQRLIWLRDHLQSTGVSPRAINLTLIFVRGIASAAAGLGLISEGAAGELKLVRGIPVPAKRAAPGRLCSPGEVAALFAVCWQDHSIDGIRDLALLHGIYWAGLSTAKLAGLQLEDYTLTPPVLRVEPARSARRRQVELADQTADVFRRWRATRGSRPGALFVRLGRGGQQTGQRMSSSAITNVVRQRAKRTGLRLLTPQDLRRTAIHELIESGLTLANVHRRFGFVSHVTLATRYDPASSQASVGKRGSPRTCQNSALATLCWSRDHGHERSRGGAR